MSVEKKLMLAKKMAKNGQIEAARDLFQSVLDKFPKNRRAIDGLKKLPANSGAGGSGLPKIQLNGLIQLFNDGNFQTVVKQALKLSQIYPREAPLFGLLGASFLRLNQHDEAVSNYEKSLNLNLTSTELKVSLGYALIKADRAFEAIEKLKAVVDENPNFEHAHLNLGLAYKATIEFELAQKCFEKVHQINPKSTDGLFNLANILAQIDDFDAADRTYEKAMELAPRRADIAYNRAHALERAGRYEAALEFYKISLNINPNQASALNNIAVIHKMQGNKKEARRSFESALTIAPDEAELHRNLTTVKTFRSGDPHISQISRLLNDTKTSELNKMHLRFAMAKAQEDLGDYQTAYSSYVSANQLRKTVFEYDLKDDLDEFKAIKNCFLEWSKDKPQSNTNPFPTTKRAVFILGMPRSGTSLVEKILASHPKVYGAGELEFLNSSVNSIQWKKNGLNQDNVQKIANHYRDAVNAISTEKTVITDKMPLNFRWVGFAIAALPDAKILHVHRDPTATCWSIFKHYFNTTGNGFGYNIDDLVGYYQAYLDLMLFWHDRFPERIVDIDYENLTKNQEIISRKIVSSAALNWDPACLEFQHSKQVVATASNIQVNQPMYQNSSKAWRDFQPWISPLVDKIKTISASGQYLPAIHRKGK